MRIICIVLLHIILIFLPHQAWSKEPKIVQISPDIYEIFKEDKAGIYGDAYKMKVNVVNQANALAASMNKALIPISVVEHPIGIWFDWASFKYTFKLVDVNDPIAKRTQLDITTNLIVSRPDEMGATNISIVSPSNKNDLYSELIKLEDLRKRGILTDAEFEAQKKKLLDGQ